MGTMLYSKSQIILLFPIVKNQGCFIWDLNNKKYVDFSVMMLVLIFWDMQQKY